jgi:hypothetical protein
MSFLDRSLASFAKKEVIIPFLEEALIKDNSFLEEYSIRVINKERIFDGMFHPSSDTELGEYQLYYKFHPKFHDLLENERLSPTSKLTMQIGSALHAVIESVLVQLGFCKMDDVEVKFIDKKRMISGTVDILKLRLPNGEEYLVDIKSTSRKPEERYNYSMQLRLYQDLCPGAPEKMILLYIEKAYPHNLYEIVVEKDDKALNDLYDRWDRVKVAISTGDTKELKRCCGDRSEKRYMTCPARHICKFYNE